MSHIRHPVEGDVWEHYKGGLYRILAVARMEDDLESVVVYFNIESPEDVWVRPLDEFCDTVRAKHGPRRRFLLLESVVSQPGGDG